MTNADEKEKKRRDKNFAKLKRWFADAEDVAEIIKEELPRIREAIKNAEDKLTDDELSVGMMSAYSLISFLTPLYQDRFDNHDNYIGAPEEQKDLYPHLALGLMFIAQVVGETAFYDLCERGDE